jgi:hypothetical protein
VLKLRQIQVELFTGRASPAEQVVDGATLFKRGIPS